MSVDLDKGLVLETRSVQADRLPSSSRTHLDAR